MIFYTNKTPYLTPSSNWETLWLMIMMFFINILALMTNKLLNLWILLEINMLIFIFIMTSSLNTTQIPLMFFILQTLTSLILLWIFLMNYYPLNNDNNMFLIILMITLSMKLGFYPFTSIPPMMIKNFNWLTLFSYTMLYKFIIYLMIKNLINNKLMNILLMMCLLSMILSTSWALNCNNLKSIMAFSSINNSCWLTILVIFNFNFFIFYYILYFIIFFMLTLLFTKLKIQTFKSFTYLSLMPNYPITILYISILMFIMSMIPPTTYFILKLNSLMLLIYMKMNLFTFMFMLVTTMSILMYINIIIKILYFMNYKPSFFYSFKIMSFNSLTFLSMLMILPSIFILMFMLNSN